MGDVRFVFTAFVAGDDAIFTEKPLVITEDASRILLKSDFTPREVERIGVPDSEGVGFM